MRRLMIFGASMVLFFQLEVYAQSTTAVDSANAEVQAAKRLVEDAQKQLKEAEKAEARLADKVQDILDRERRARGALDNASGFWGRRTPPPQLKDDFDKARQEREKAETELREAEKAVNAARRALDDRTTDFNKAQKAASTAEALEKEALKRILSQGLMLDFAVLRAKFTSTDLALNRLEQEYDKSLIGAYFKDKLALLVNSNVMCKAVKDCSTRRQAEVPMNEIEKELFPGTAPSSRSGSQLDRARGRTAK